LELIVQERRKLRVCDNLDVPTPTAVAAVGTAARHVSLTPKGNAARPTVTGADQDRYFIDKLVTHGAAYAASRGEGRCLLLRKWGGYNRADGSELLSQGLGVDPCLGATLVLLVAHHTVDQSKEGVVFAHAHVATGVNFGAPLANQDVSG